MVFKTNKDAAMSVFEDNAIDATPNMIDAAPYMYEALRQVVFKRLGKSENATDIALTMAEIALDKANGVYVE